MQTLISIIIPVYKVENYLRRCVDSVISQTYKNLEIILIDDGSPDKSPEICDEYMLKDSRIKVIHKVNEGVSSARNAGLDIATGKYVCFVDSDDFIPNDSVESLFRAITKNDCQFASGMCVFEGTNSVKNQIPDTVTIDFDINPTKLLKYLCMPGSYSPYAKIYELKIIKDNNIRYNAEHKCSEDSLMIRQYLKYCRRICLTPHIVYEYNKNNENSLSKKAYPDYCLYFTDKLKALNELTNTLHISEYEKKQFLTQRAVHGLKISIIHYLTNFKDIEKQKVLLKTSIELLSPWIFQCNLEKDNNLYKWWKQYEKYVRNNQFEKFFKTAKRSYFISEFKRKINKLIKSCLRKKSNHMNI